MKAYIGIGISIGILAGIWTQISSTLGLMTWVGFIAWALYFATGTKMEGVRTTLASVLSGVFWSWLTVLALGTVTFPGALAVFVGILALILCLQAGIPALSYIPGAFIGAALYFGTLGSTEPPPVWITAIVVVIGVAFAFTSDIIGARIQALVDGRSTSAPTAPASAQTA